MTLVRAWARQHPDELVEDWARAEQSRLLVPIAPLDSDRPAMLEIAAVEALEDRFIRMTLSDGTVVIRDLGGLLTGLGVFERITNDDGAFREVFVDYGTLVWPGKSTSRPRP